MSCYATKRISIRWPPAEPYEDTDTLVLSVNEHYVDVRVKKDYQRIDWAFAGTKRVEADGRHVWTHSIDSRGSKEEDSGYVTIMDNGDELESGSMRNPETDTIMKHQEVWRALPLTLNVGFIAVCKAGDSFAACVDTHFLIVHVAKGETSVARFVRTDHKAAWTRLYLVDPTSRLYEVDSAWIEDLQRNPDWNIVASVNM